MTVPTSLNLSAFKQWAKDSGGKGRILAAYGLRSVLSVR